VDDSVWSHGHQAGELLTYQPTWHHGHAVMRFLPDKRTGKGSAEGPRVPPHIHSGFRRATNFTRSLSVGIQLNKILYDLRFKQNCGPVDNDIQAWRPIWLPIQEAKVLETLQDEDIEKFRNGKSIRWWKRRAPTRMWMSVIVSIRVAQTSHGCRQVRRRNNKRQAVTGSTGFSLCGLILPGGRAHRLKSVPRDR